MDEIKALLTGSYKKLTEMDDKLHKVNSNVMEVTMGLSVSQSRPNRTSLKVVFLVSFAKCVLVVFVYNCAHLRQNLPKNTCFEMLRSFCRADFG